MRRTFIIPTALLLSALALTGCSAGGASYDSSTVPGEAPVPAQGTPLTQEFSESGDGTKTETGGDAIDRQVITTGYVTITVDEPMDAATEAIRIAESVGGRVDGRSEYAPVDGDKGSATLTLRLPADTLTATLDKLKALGDVQEISLNSSDVTMVTQDLDARINALKASVDRLLALLASATDTDTLITLETAISDRQAQLESMESERRYYADQVSLSTVTLNLVTEQVVPVEAPDTFLSGLQAGWDAFVGFFAGLVVALGVLLPWLIFAAAVTFVIIFIVRRTRRRDEVAAAPTVE
jgi:Domain of unknown function (DUF4349)